MTTLPDRLLAYAVKQEQVRDALGIPAHDFVDQQEIDDLREAAAALSDHFVDANKMVPEGREAVAQVNVSADSTDLCWIDGAAKRSFDGRIGTHLLYTTPQPGDGMDSTRLDWLLARINVDRWGVCLPCGSTPPGATREQLDASMLPAAPSAKGVAK